jgi:hypothetical protein
MRTLYNKKSPMISHRACKRWRLAILPLGIAVPLLLENGFFRRRQSSDVAYVALPHCANQSRFSLKNFHFEAKTLFQ